MAPGELPRTVRATAVIQRSLLGRQRRAFLWDVMYADRRVERDVDIDAALQGGRLPADAWATRAAAEATCPETGAGDWVEYAYGRRLEDPPSD